jgi:class 3 adenylate cyclase
VTAAVVRRGGVVSSYMGDGIMAFFAPDGPEPPSLRAVRAGLDMLAEAERRRPELHELYGRSFDLNVGVHVGPTIVGSIAGDGAPVTAIGDTVNFASRIEQANKEFGTRFLMSDATLADLGDRVLAGRTFESELPGKAGVHTLIEVVGLR